MDELNVAPGGAGLSTSIDANNSLRTADAITSNEDARGNQLDELLLLYCTTSALVGYNIMMERDGVAHRNLIALAVCHSVQPSRSKHGIAVLTQARGGIATGRDETSQFSIKLRGR